MILLCPILMLGLVGSPGRAADIEPEFREEIAKLAAQPKIERAFSIIEESDERALEDLITITEIPAPPFGEEKRAKAFKEMLVEAGLEDVSIDEVGNVIGVRPGTVGDRVLVLSAHLDTVFPEETDVTVRRVGERLYAPGIGDDSRGLVVVLMVLRAMNQANIQTEDDVWFVGTVGEEGLGDLRGVKHLFREGAPKIDAFITIDGGGETGIANAALGSFRYRVSFSGPGGHSWAAFGTANPAHALGRAIYYFEEAASAFVGDGPRTSFNVGRIGGGTSINSVPFENWMEIDVRSVEQGRLVEMDSLLRAAVQRALEEANEKRDRGDALTANVEKIGDRPSGETAASTPLVQRTMAAVSYVGFEPRLASSSTDANVPISMGIPAVRIGRGGRGGGAHSLDEWWMNENAHLSIQRTLLITVAEAGFVEGE